MFFLNYAHTRYVQNDGYDKATKKDENRLRIFRPQGSRFILAEGAILMPPRTPIYPRTRLLKAYHTGQKLGGGVIN